MKVRLSWYERFLNRLSETNLYVRQGKTNTLERKNALRRFFHEMEKEIYIEAYAHGFEGVEHRYPEEGKDES